MQLTRTQDDARARRRPAASGDRCPPWTPRRRRTTGACCSRRSTRSRRRTAAATDHLPRGVLEDIHGAVDVQVDGAPPRLGVDLGDGADRLAATSAVHDPVQRAGPRGGRLDDAAHFVFVGDVGRLVEHVAAIGGQGRDLVGCGRKLVGIVATIITFAPAGRPLRRPPPIRLPPPVTRNRVHPPRELAPLPLTQTRQVLVIPTTHVKGCPTRRRRRTERAPIRNVWWRPTGYRFSSAAAECA